MEEAMITGGCYCGKIRYEAHGAPYDPTICHCVDCRRVAGAPFVAWFSLAAMDLKFVAGAPKRFASSAKATRTFCADCGTPLTYQGNTKPGQIDITTCSLDDPASLPPAREDFAGERLAWVRDCSWA